MFDGKREIIIPDLSPITPSSQILWFVLRSYLHDTTHKYACIYVLMYYPGYLL